MKCVIYTTTKGGHSRVTFAPNEESYNSYLEYFVEREETVVAINKDVKDVDYLRLKFAVRTMELENTLTAYDKAIESGVSKDITDALFQSIDLQVGVLIGMVRRKEKKDYGFNIDSTVGLLLKWEEREDV